MVTKVIESVIEAVSKSLKNDTLDKVVRELNQRLREAGINVRIRKKELEPILEKFKDPEEGGTVFVGADDVIYLVFKKLGYPPTFKTGRATIVVMPKRIKCRDETAYDGVRVYVIGDSDSGVAFWQSVDIVGGRFGLSILGWGGNGGEIWVSCVDIPHCFGNPTRAMLIRAASSILQDGLSRFEGESEEHYKMKKGYCLFMAKVLLMFLEYLDVLNSDRKVPEKDLFEEVSQLLDKAKKGTLEEGGLIDEMMDKYLSLGKDE